MSVVVFAYHEMGYTALQWLIEKGVEVSAVFTYRDSPDESCWFPSVAQLAQSAWIPTFFTESVNQASWVDQIAALEPELLVSVYYRHILGRRLLSLAPRGAVNLHGSLLPKYRGRCPLNWQLVHGETRSGVTLHHMVRRADAGDIVGQEAVDVGPDDTALDLHKKLLRAARRTLDRFFLALLDGSAPRTPQDHSQATTFGGRCPEDGRIDWQRPAREIHNLVRAVSRPWPGAFCDLPAGRLRVWRTRILGPDASRPLLPGQIAVVDGLPLIGTGTTPLGLLEYEGEAGSWVAGLA